jgi:hypothetical protein
MGRRVRSRINDDERLKALEAAAEEHGSEAEAIRHAIDVVYVDGDDEDNASTRHDLPTDLSDAYGALVDRYGTDSRIGLESAKSVVAQATKTPADATEKTVLEPLRQRGYIGVHPGRASVTVIIPERTAAENQTLDGFVTDGGTDPRDALAENGRLYDGAAARGGAGKTVHIDDDCSALAEDYDDITEPAELPLRARVCQKCDPEHEIDYTVGNNPRDDVPAIEDDDRLDELADAVDRGDGVESDGAGERIAVSPLTGIAYAVAEYEEDADGRLVAFDKRPLTRAEIADRVSEVHAAARAAYDDLGGDRDD